MGDGEPEKAARQDSDSLPFMRAAVDADGVYTLLEGRIDEMFAAAGLPAVGPEERRGGKGGSAGGAACHLKKKEHTLETVKEGIWVVKKGAILPDGFVI